MPGGIFIPGGIFMPGIESFLAEDFFAALPDVAAGGFAVVFGAEGAFPLVFNFAGLRGFAGAACDVCSCIADVSNIPGIFMDIASESADMFNMR